MNIAVLGAAWGDEGKGHIVHHLSPRYDWVVRFNGGANAGHTIYRDNVKYVHNLMPSFDWRADRTKAFLGSGMVIDLEQLHKEVNAIVAATFQFQGTAIAKRIYVDPDAFIVLPEHKDEDKANNGHIGSTNRGIGPAYKSKIARKGTRIRDVMEGASEHRHWIEGMKKLGVQFKGLLELRREMEHADLLFEGAQGVMLDINHGLYPYVSCSESTVAGVYSCGFHWAPPTKVYGVAKVYTTKVGEGPFPTELGGEEAHKLRERGQEYGATTGRPRRIGWLDLPALNYACQKGGITDLILTKFDILNGMDKIPVCVAYQKDPTCSSDFFTAAPQYIDVSGWENANNDEELVDFIRCVERGTQVPVSYISRGTTPNDIVGW